MIFNISGGGGTALNFQVIGDDKAPGNAKENTIWINTTEKITSWIFSATEPQNPIPGMVWISIGTSSTVAFNALKKNGIQVYPISAKQYIGGAWVDKTAMTYQGGAWVNWINILLGSGITNVLGTPDFVSLGNSTATGSRITTAANQNSDGTMGISVKTTSGYWTHTAAVFPAKVSNKDKTLTVSLVCTSISSSTSSDSLSICLYSDSGAKTELGNKTVFICNSVNLDTTYTVDIDVSDIDSYYIAVKFVISSNSKDTMAVTVKEVKTT